MALLIKMTLNLLEFKKLLVIYSLIVCMLMQYLRVISLIYLHGLLDNVDFLDCELNSTKFNDVSSLHNVVNFFVAALKASHY
jgi:hypothetical protein